MCASSACAWRTASSARRRSVMSLLVSRNAAGAPCSSRRTDQRLATTTWVPSFLSVHELAFPATCSQHLRLDLLERRRKDRLQQFVTDSPCCVLCRPPVQFF